MKLSRRMELYNGDLLFREFKPELIDEAKVLEQALDDAITDANNQRQKYVLAESENRKLKKQLENNVPN